MAPNRRQQEFELPVPRHATAPRRTHAPPQPQRSAARHFDQVSRAGNKSSSRRRTPYSARAQINSPNLRHCHHALDARKPTTSSPALAENTNAAPATAEPVVAAKKAKTSVEGKASPTKVVEAPAEEPKRKESGEGAVAEKPAEPAAEPAKEVPVPRRQRLLHAIELCAGPAVDRFTQAEPAKPEEAAKPAEEPAKEAVVEAPKEAAEPAKTEEPAKPAEEPKAEEPAKAEEPKPAEEAKA